MEAALVPTPMDRESYEKDSTGVRVSPATKVSDPQILDSLNTLGGQKESDFERSEDACEMARRVEQFVREIVIPFEADHHRGVHGPDDQLLTELRALAREAGVLTPHLLKDGNHRTHRDTAMILIRSGLSPLGPAACNTMSPDEGNMVLLSKVATAAQKERFLGPIVSGEARSAFFMTEPAAEGGAGSDPSMMMTTCVKDGDDWIINGRKAFITGAVGAKVGIIMAKSDLGACMFLVDLPNPAINIDRVLETIDSSMPGGHSMVTIQNLRVPKSQMLGKCGEGFQYAQVRLSPARLSHCMRWLGACIRANEIATYYVCHRHGFGKLLIDHEGVGFMLADNLIDLRQSELMINWCADVLDRGSLGTIESSMTKVSVSEALMRVADRCVQVMGAIGVSRETIVEQVFREIRAFRIYDGPTEVHKWSIAKEVKRNCLKKDDR